MGRTAAAFLILAVVGGCVADDQGPLAQFPAAKPGQTAAAPSYATWSRTSDQFADLQNNTSAKPSATTAQKPTSAPKPAVTKLPPPAPTPGASDIIVDSQLVDATLVTTPGDKSAEKTADKAASAKPAPSGHSALEVDQAANDPAAPSIRMVNSKRVTLNFELKDVGASGVSGVELWCTQDAHTWKKGEIEAQTNHSFTVEVKEEGLYGFTLLARNGSGVGKEDAPAPGEQPQVWVMVDVTKPTVQISSVEITRAGKEPTVEIHWSAKDKNLGPKPITLSYAEQPEGPWTPIAAGVENSGQYEWQPPTTAPHRLYLRVEAVDMPGNSAWAQTANPLRLDAAAAAAPVVPPPADLGHKTLPAPPALDTSRPTAAILAVEPGAN